MNSVSWKKSEDENGFIHYINESTNLHQWDHPKYFEIKQKLDDCNYIKYASYRVASKFRVLQNALHMNYIPLAIISGVFERHRLGATESTLNLDPYDIEAVLLDIYFAANKQNNLNTDIDLASELMINFLYNIYDRDRKLNIQVVAIKLALALLCNNNLNDIYRFIFQLCSDHNNCVTRYRLQLLLSKLTDITNYLHENSNFGTGLISTAIESCFYNSPGFLGVNEIIFIFWMESGQDLFSWLPILHRLKYSETVIHASKCSVCRLTPLIGLKYRCIKCNRYIQCQQCFLSGRISNSHKLSHPVKEYFQETSTKDLALGIFRKICGKVNYKNNDCISKIVDVKLPCTDSNMLLNTTPTEVICNIESLSSPMAQLQVIIRQLELQNRELQQMILIGNKADHELKIYLEDHRLQVATQINKLKILKDYLRSSAPSYVSNVANSHLIKNPQAKFEPCPDFFSTPMLNDKPPRFSVNMLSPITFRHNLTNLEELTERSIDSKETDDNILKNNLVTDFSKTDSYSMADISSWIGGPPFVNSLSKSLENKPKPYENHSEDGLDAALDKLQQILANNFVLDESLGNVDNGQLKSAVTEVEGMLTSIIDNVESNEIAKYKNNFNRKT